MSMKSCITTDGPLNNSGSTVLTTTKRHEPSPVPDVLPPRLACDSKVPRFPSPPRGFIFKEVISRGLLHVICPLAMHICMPRAWENIKGKADSVSAASLSKLRQVHHPLLRHAVADNEGRFPTVQADPLQTSFETELGKRGRQHARTITSLGHMPI